jgi:hypothetical protein
VLLLLLLSQEGLVVAVASMLSLESEGISGLNSDRRDAFF